MKRTASKKIQLFESNFLQNNTAQPGTHNDATLRFDRELLIPTDLMKHNHPISEFKWNKQLPTFTLRN